MSQSVAVHPPVPLARNRRFVALWCARTVSVGGDGFGRVALAFGVLGLRGATPARLSLVLAAQALPQVLLVLAGGVIADRVRRSRLLMAADLLAALSWTAITMVIATRQSLFVPLAVLGFCAGTASAMMWPTLTGITPELVAPPQLRQANAMLRIGHYGALTVGLAFAGVVVAAFGPVLALGFNAASFAGSVGLLALIGSVREGERTPSHPLRELAEGAREFFSHQWLWVIALQYGFVIACSQALIGVLGPVVAERSLGGARTWGFISGSLAAGTLVGALLAMRIRARRPMRTVVLLTTGHSIPIVTVAAHAPLPLILAGGALSGMATAIIGVLWDTTVQHHVPARLLSRVSSFDVLLSVSLAPLGLFVAGPAASVWGAERVLWVTALIIGATVVAALLSPSVRTVTDVAPLDSRLSTSCSDSSGSSDNSGSSGTDEPPQVQPVDPDAA